MIAHPYRRKLQTLILRYIGGGTLENLRPCGCFDYHSKSSPLTFYIFPCDTCGSKINNLMRKP